MVLGADKIISMIKNGVEVEDPVTKEIVIKPLITPLDESQVEGIEGTTVDLRLGSVWRTYGKARLLREERITPKITKEIDIEDKNPKDIFTIYPGDYYLLQTIETVNMPNNLFAYLRPRTSLIRSGIPLETAFVSPNYQGKLTVGVKNQSKNLVEIQLGFRIMCIAFFPIDGEAVPYRGVWQGGRVSTNGEVERPY